MLAGVVGLLVVSLAAPPASFARRTWHLLAGTSVSERDLSASDWRALGALDHGTLIARTPRNLDGVGVSEIRLVASRDEIRFFVIRREDGSRCYALGLASSGNHFGQVSCPGPTFPTQARPILDLSGWTAVPGHSQHLRPLVGFAADGVASVGALGPSGTVARTAVHKNVYLLPSPTPGQIDAIAAFGRDGKLVHTCTKCVPPAPSFSPLPQGALLSEKRKVIQFRTSEGALVAAWVAPERSGERCSWVEINQEVRASGCADLASVEPLAGGVLRLASSNGLLLGETAPEVGLVTIRFEDQTEQRIRPSAGLFILELTSDRLVAGRRPSALVADIQREQRRVIVPLNPS